MRAVGSWIIRTKVSGLAVWILNIYISSKIAGDTYYARTQHDADSYVECSSPSSLPTDNRSAVVLADTVYGLIASCHGINVAEAGHNYNEAFTAAGLIIGNRFGFRADCSRTKLVQVPCLSIARLDTSSFDSALSCLLRPTDSPLQPFGLPK